MSEDAPHTDETPGEQRSRSGRWWKLLGGLVGLLLLIQLVPYGRAHTNPAVQTEPAWTSPKVEQLAMAACADCHSNTTKWPWYTNVAPASWLIQRDVDEGRSRMNWSEGCAAADEVKEAIAGGEMPPIQYTIKHGEARLSQAEKRQLSDGLAASIDNASGTWRECGERGGRD